MCVSLYLYFCVSAVFLYISGPVCICLCLCFYVSVCFCECVFVGVYLCICACISMYVCFHQCVFLCICACMCLFDHLGTSENRCLTRVSPSAAGSLESRLPTHFSDPVTCFNAYFSPPPHCASAYSFPRAKAEESTSLHPSWENLSSFPRGSWHMTPRGWITGS